VKWLMGSLSDELCLPVQRNTASFVAGFPLFVPRWWAASQEGFSDDFKALVTPVVEGLSATAPATAMKG